MILVLLSALGIGAGSLQMSIRSRADPNSLPGRRDNQRSNALQFHRISDSFPVPIIVREICPFWLPGYTRRFVGYIAETCQNSRLLRIVDNDASSWERLTGR